eukprot:PITA_16409
MVPIRKKNGDIRICIYFRNLNKAYQKDNFPLPPMEQILQVVAGLELMSFLDGFSRYNQVLVHPNDQLKTMFRTKWGTYAYQKMSFGLINVGATFQRAMDIAFKGLVNKSVVIYLDDIIVYSKKRGNHLRDLKQIFQRCQRYGISLNSKNSFFALSEGKLHGFIMSKSRIHIDPNIIKEISEIPLPHNKKAMQSFLGQINFVKRFVPDFSRIVSPLQEMIKKNSIFKWGQDEYEAFNLIKQAIVSAPSLATPNFSDPFILYAFASDKSYAAILTQENQDKLKTHTKFIVPFPAVRNLLVQKDVGEKRANWVTVLQKDDAEMKPANIVKGQGFCKMLAGALLIFEIPFSEVQMYEVSLNDVESLYVDIIFYLKNGYAPSNLDYTKKRALRLKAKQYQLVNDVLFRMNYDFVLLRCLEKSEAEKVLQELHDGPAGGHYAIDATAHKILRSWYYWPTLFKDAHSYVRKCQVCQIVVGKQKKPSFALQLVNIEQPFDQWGLDIIGDIVPHSFKKHRYILTATDYFTKWVEAVPLKTANVEHIIDFIDQFIITRFGLPSALMFDNASYFSGNAMTEFALKRGFKLKYSANYYPQGNGLDESTNKNLIIIIK